MPDSRAGWFGTVIGIQKCSFWLLKILLRLFDFFGIQYTILSIWILWIMHIDPTPTIKSAHFSFEKWIRILVWEALNNSLDFLLVLRCFKNSVSFYIGLICFNCLLICATNWMFGCSKYISFSKRTWNSSGVFIDLKVFHLFLGVTNISLDLPMVLSDFIYFIQFSNGYWGVFK